MIAKKDLARCDLHGAPGALEPSTTDVNVNGSVAFRTTDPGHYFGPCRDRDFAFYALEASFDVFINGRRAIGVGHAVAHSHSPGRFTLGSEDVAIGAVSVNMLEVARQNGLVMLDRSIESLERWDAEDQARFRRWFGDVTNRDLVLSNLRETRSALERAQLRVGASNDFAHYPGGDVIYLEDQFWSAPEIGHNSQAGTLVHEASHMGPGAKDWRYATDRCEDLARTDPPLAANNADSIEFFVEEWTP